MARNFWARDSADSRSDSSCSRELGHLRWATLRSRLRAIKMSGVSAWPASGGANPRHQCPDFLMRASRKRRIQLLHAPTPDTLIAVREPPRPGDLAPAHSRRTSLRIEKHTRFAGLGAQSRAEHAAAGPNTARTPPSMQLSERHRQYCAANPLISFSVSTSPPPFFDASVFTVTLPQVSDAS